jgi:hypothetical protein
MRTLAHLLSGKPMADNSLIPITDEQAKLGQEALKVLQGFGSFLGKALGDLPQTLVNYLGGDWLRVRRAENLLMMLRRASERLERRGVMAPISPSLSVTLPLFRSAADESRDGLQDLWARLLAAAMDPSRTNLVRQRFAEAIHKLDPPDTRVLSSLSDRGGGISQGDLNARATELGMERDELEVSLENLVRAELLSEASTNVKMVVLSPFGREFLRAMMD